jgi:penicillin-binding protein 2
MTRRQQLKNTHYERRVYRHRVAISIIFVITMTSILIARYGQLQITDYNIYKTHSDRNRIQLLPIAPKRGLIFDRNGVLLAENIPSYTLTVVKERVASLDDTLAIIGELIPLADDDIEQFRKRLSRRRPYEAVPLKFRVSDEEIAKIAVNRYRNWCGTILTASYLLMY